MIASWVTSRASTPHKDFDVRLRLGSTAVCVDARSGRLDTSGWTVLQEELLGADTADLGVVAATSEVGHDCRRYLAWISQIVDRLICEDSDSEDALFDVIARQLARSCVGEIVVISGERDAESQKTLQSRLRREAGRLGVSSTLLLPKVSSAPSFGFAPNAPAYAASENFVG